MWTTRHRPPSVHGSRPRLRLMFVAAIYMTAVASCGSDDSSRVEASASTAGPGFAAHVAGPLDETSAGDCVESELSVVPSNDGAMLVIGTSCQVCCGYERALTPEEARRAAEPLHVHRVESDSVTLDAQADWSLPSPTARLAVSTTERDYAIDSENVYVRDASSAWEVALARDELKFEFDENEVITTPFVDLVVDGDGSIVVAAGNGLLRVASDGGQAWVLPPKPLQMVETPLEVGAAVPRDSTASITELEHGPTEGTYLLIDDVGLTLFDQSTGSRKELLTDATPAPADARLVPPTVSSVGAVSSCCVASSLSGVAVDELGRVLVLDATFGRLLRVTDGGDVERLLGPERAEDACRADCPPASDTFGADGTRSARNEDVRLVPSALGPQPNTMSFDPVSGDLFVALGARGAVRLNLAD